ncbi:RNA polymerase sigma factor RpoD [Vibrio astriarenae]|nr:RNA polymerase sigma factor RpoD [Vibrio sp. C7]
MPITFFATNPLFCSSFYSKRCTWSEVTYCYILFHKKTLSLDKRIERTHFPTTLVVSHLRGLRKMKSSEACVLGGNLMARETYDLVSKYLSDIGGTRFIDAIEEAQLGMRVRYGDQQARDKLIEAHLRLVVRIAKHYSTWFTGILNFLDLIEEGNVGLIKAVDKFDPEKGYRFSTHAMYWIKDSIQVAIINHSRTVRLPANVHREIVSLARENRQIKKCIQREVGSAELMRFTKVDSRRVDFLMLWGGYRKFS